MSLRETKHGFARVLTNKYFYLMNTNEKTINALSLIGIGGGLTLVALSMTFFGGVFITLFTLSLTANLFLTKI
jgi:hypothetical protein